MAGRAAEAGVSTTKANKYKRKKPSPGREKRRATCQTDISPPGLMCMT
jgi:hypothetical protein